MCLTRIEKFDVREEQVFYKVFEVRGDRLYSTIIPTRHLLRGQWLHERGYRHLSNRDTIFVHASYGEAYELGWHAFVGEESAYAYVKYCEELFRSTFMVLPVSLRGIHTTGIQTHYGRKQERLKHLSSAKCVVARELFIKEDAHVPD